MAVHGPKSSLQLYRDIMRLIKHMAGTTSPKALQLKHIVSTQFRANKHVTDQAQLHQLKSMAERGLSNYLIFQTAKTDPKIAAHAAETERFEDDDEGRLVKVLDTPRVQVYPHKRPSKQAQAAGEIEPELAGAAATAEGYRKAGKASAKVKVAGGTGATAGSLTGKGAGNSSSSGSDSGSTSPAGSRKTAADAGAMR